MTRNDMPARGGRQKARKRERGAEPPIAAAAFGKLQHAAHVLETPAASRLVWDRLLTEAERKDVETQDNRTTGTIAMWMQLRGVSQPVAIVQMGLGINLLTRQDAAWLLDEIREVEPSTPTITEVEDTLAPIIGPVLGPVDAAQLVRTQRRARRLVLAREVEWLDVYWRDDAAGHTQAEPVKEQADATLAAWKFLWLLAKEGHGAHVIDPGTVEDEGLTLSTKDARHRLKKLIPESLDRLIEAQRQGAYRLDLPIAEIALIEVTDGMGRLVR